MNCEMCQELLSDFLDGTLPVGERAQLSRHLEECLDCAAVREELAAVVTLAHESREQLVAPPDAHAMWLRIRNTIEADARTGDKAKAAHAPGQGFWAGLAGKRWAFSLPQLATVASGVAVAVALVTAFGMRAILTRQGNEPQSRIARHQLQNPNDAVMIEYLRQRVEQRRTRWNPRMREAFDQNMTVIDETVNEMMKELDERPHDSVSEETLNAAMRDKIELLKQFSEL